MSTKASFPPQVPERAVILLAVDGSTVSGYAAAAAARFSLLPGSEVHILHVLNTADGKEAAKALESGRALLERVAAGSGLESRATYHLGGGTAWKAIVQLAADLQADLVVVGAHDLNAVEKVFLGSVSEKVVQHAGCPVYVARRKDHTTATPEIEPACPACLETQRTTGGKSLWCAQHDHRHAQGRLHYELPQGYGAGSNLLRV